MLSASERIRIALLNLRDDEVNQLAPAFADFGFRAPVMFSKDGRALNRDHIAACVVALDDSSAPEILNAARLGSRSGPIFTYGIVPEGTNTYATPSDVNAVFRRPLQPAHVLQVISSTRLSVIQGSRQARRLPVRKVVSVNMAGIRFQALSQDISAGGMCLQFPERPDRVGHMLLSVFLDSHRSITVTAAPCWTSETENLVGIRFGERDERRLEVENWVSPRLPRV